MILSSLIWSSNKIKYISKTLEKNYTELKSNWIFWWRKNLSCDINVIFLKPYLSYYTEIFTDQSVWCPGFASNSMGQDKGWDMDETRLAMVEDWHKYTGVHYTILLLHKLKTLSINCYQSPLYTHTLFSSLSSKIHVIARVIHCSKIFF